jgi:hypothetical protein
MRVPASRATVVPVGKYCSRAITPSAVSVVNFGLPIRTGPGVRPSPGRRRHSHRSPGRTPPAPDPRRSATMAGFNRCTTRARLFSRHIKMASDGNFQRPRRQGGGRYCAGADPASGACRSGIGRHARPSRRAVNAPFDESAGHRYQQCPACGQKHRQTMTIFGCHHVPSP